MPDLNLNLEVILECVWALNLADEMPPENRPCVLGDKFQEADGATHPLNRMLDGGCALKCSAAAATARDSNVRLAGQAGLPPFARPRWKGGAALEPSALAPTRWTGVPILIA
eukprot:2867578-Pyramimonas_sp.AAC.1